ncbi:hypothetical protein LJB42_004253 [Komagataella kurtzmanii]|nr:hypothetical protein LJB42_004253 [Komagataella kurtzmanii]
MADQRLEDEFDISRYLSISPIESASIEESINGLMSNWIPPAKGEIRDTLTPNASFEATDSFSTGSYQEIIPAQVKIKLEFDNDQQPVFYQESQPVYDKHLTVNDQETRSAQDLNQYLNADAVSRTNSISNLSELSTHSHITPPTLLHDQASLSPALLSMNSDERNELNLETLQLDQTSQPYVNQIKTEAAYEELSELHHRLERLTETNLIHQDQLQLEQQEQQTQTPHTLSPPIQLQTPIIKVLQAPNDIAANTPSLFSQSNHSSPYNTPKHSRSNSLSSNDRQHDIPQISSVLDSSSFLVPGDQFQAMREGRQRRKSESNSRNSKERSKSREPPKSRSRSRDSATDHHMEVMSRDKTLELAASQPSSKTPQKNPSIYACSLCSKRFTRPYNLKSHLRTHADERPFQCSICGKAFARSHDRKRHEDLHSGERKYCCKGVLSDGVTTWGCEKRFARTDALGRHFKTECGKLCIKPLMDELKREDAYRRNEPVTEMNDELYSQSVQDIFSSQRLGQNIDD